MTRVDRYILFLFLRVFATCYISLTGLMIVVHLFTNLDDLIEVGKVQGGVAKLLISYYAPYSLSMFTRLCPFFALMAILFTVAWLKRTHELTALMAAGISKGRILRFPLFAVVGLLLISLGLREFVIPQHQDILGKNPQDLSGENMKPLRPSLDPATNILINGTYVEPLNQRILGASFHIYGSETSFGRQLKAAAAKYLEANDQRPAGYFLSGITHPVTIDLQDDLIHEDRTIIYTSKNTPWLKPKECFVVSTVPFFLLQGSSGWSQYESTWNIIRRLHAQPSFFGPDVHVVAHSRFVQPVLDLTMVLFGLPIVLRRVDRHLVWISLAVMGAVLVFFAVTTGAQGIASSSSLISPFLGAWIPVLLLFPLSWARVQVAMQS